MNKTLSKGKVVPVLIITEHHAMKAYWGSGDDSSTHSSTAALGGGEWSASRPGRYTTPSLRKVTPIPIV
jgi:hypothetical protein